MIERSHVLVTSGWFRFLAVRRSDFECRERIELSVGPAAVMVRRLFDAGGHLWSAFSNFYKVLDSERR